MIENYKLHEGDCIEIMNSLIQQGVKVDAVICDPPYGTTACKWDSVIPFGDMWNCLNQLVKPRGAVVLFGSQPFSSKLISSNLNYFKYEIIWNKKKAGLFMLAKKRILPAHENIIVFCKSSHIYNPQMSIKPKKDIRPQRKNDLTKHKSELGYIKRKHSDDYNESLKYPTSILEYSKESAECNNTKRVHPTQKPVVLMEYLIKTYTNERGIVLDFTMGSGSTGVACMNTNRRFIGIERDDKYFSIATDRIKESEQIRK